MKKIILFILLLLLSVGLMGQTSATAEVTATVQSVLTLAKNVDINFGNISATSTPIMDPKGLVNTDLGAGYTIGQFDIGGSDGVGVLVSFDATVVLGDGTNIVTYTPVIYGHEDTQATSSLVTQGGEVILGATGYKLWVGGNLGTLTSQATGVYTASATNGGGLFTITLDYN